MAAMNTRSAQHLDVPTTGRRLDQLKIAVAAMRSALWDMERAIEEIEPMNLSPETGLYVTREVPEVDPLVYRVGELREGCEAILKRPLNALERGIVMSWSSLERDAELVPVTEILDLTRSLLSRPTPDGTLPSTLKWCDATVQTLQRAPVAALRGRGRRNQATELASMYDEMAEQLESGEAR
jgi:hypothetical protein